MPRRPDGLTLAAFCAVVIIGGSTFVAVRFSNRELPPFLGAGIRFGLAAIMLLALSRLQSQRLPRGRALAGAALFGLIGFTLAQALTYKALVYAPAALGAVIAGAAPLVTVLLAALQRVEAFRWPALAGALFAIVGVAIMTRAPTASSVPVAALLALLGVAFCVAESSIVVKQFPTTDPVPFNAVAMAVSTPRLLLLSLLAGEHWRIPVQPTTWLTLGYVVPVGTVGLFVLIVFVLNRWTATAMSYATVLFPIVSLGGAAVLAGEAISPALIAGAAVSMAGVYIGAIWSSR